MSGIQFIVLNKEDGKEKISIVDDYLKAMKPFERSLKMSVSDNITLEEFITFLKENVCEWTSEDKRKLNISISKLKSRLEELNISIPNQIYVVKTSGKEEWNSAYTKNNIIILPEKKIANYSDEGLLELLSHEFFHIYSRFNDIYRKKLYGLLGFRFIENNIIPIKIKELTIVNPDALQEVYTEVRYKNNIVKVSPLIMIKSNIVDNTKDILESLKIKLFIFNSEEVINAEEINEYVKKMCINTNNIQHPEEVLAENFTYLLVGKNDIPNTKFLEEIKMIIEDK